MKRIILCFLAFLMFSCNQTENNKTVVKEYFDLKGYFKNEIDRLAKHNPKINKTVFVNGSKEQKLVVINNWQNELQSFIDADINKSSWKGSFNLKTEGKLKTYTSLDEKIPVKKLDVAFIGNKVTSIKIVINNVNKLYTSTDSLIYIPDSLYQVKKSQHIKLMEPKIYEIKGLF